MLLPRGCDPGGWVETRKGWPADGDKNRGRYLRSHVAALPVSEAIPLSEVTPEFFASHRVDPDINHPKIGPYPLFTRHRRWLGWAGERSTNVWGLRYGESYRVYVGLELVEDGEVVSRTMAVSSMDLCERCETEEEEEEEVVPAPVLSLVTEGRKRYTEEYAIVEYRYTVDATPEGWVEARGGWPAGSDMDQGRYLRSHVAVLPVSEAVEAGEVTSEFFASHRVGLDINHPTIGPYPPRHRQWLGWAGERFAKVSGLRYGERYRVYVGLELVEDGEVVSRTMAVSSMDLCERCETEEEKVVPELTLSEIEGQQGWRVPVDAESYVMLHNSYRVGVAPGDWAAESEARVLYSRVVVLPIAEAVDASEATPEFFSSLGPLAPPVRFVARMGWCGNEPLHEYYAFRHRRTLSAPGWNEAPLMGPLRYGKRYRVYFVLEAEEDGEVVASTVETVDICEDCEELSFSEGPTPEEVRGQSFVVSYVANIGSSRQFTSHAVVLPSGATQPSAAQIKAGQDSQGRTAIAAFDHESNSFQYAYVNSVDGEYVRDDESGTLVNGCHTFWGGFLSPSTTYEAYVLYGTPEGSPIIGHTQVTTADESLLLYFATGPMGEKVKERDFFISYIANVGGSGKVSSYMVVLPSGAASPTVAQIKAGQDGQGNAALGTFYYNGVSPEYAYGDFVDGEFVRDDVSGAFINVCQAFKGGFLRPSTTYEAYVLYDTPEASAPIIGRTQVTTKEATLALSFSAGPMAEEVKERSFVISYIANVGTYKGFTSYMVVLPSGAARPSAAQIRAKQDGQGRAALATFYYNGVSPEYAYGGFVDGEFVRDDESGTLVNVCQAFKDGFVSPDTTYEIYVLYNTPGAIAPIVGHTRVTTAEEGLVLSFSAGPMAEEVKERSFVISYIANVGSSNSGTFIANMVVLPSGSPQPTAEQIRAGQDSQGNDALGTFYYNGVSPEYVHVDLVDGEYVRNASSGALVSVCQAFKGGFVRPNTTYEAYVLHNTPEAIAPIIGHARVTTKEEGLALSFSAGPMTEGVLARSFVVSFIADVGSSRHFSSNMVVLPSGSARPTAAQIKAGQDGQGNAALGTYYYNGVSPDYAYVDLVDGRYVRNDESGTLVNVCQMFAGGFVSPETTYEAYVLYTTPEATTPIVGHTQVTTAEPTLTLSFSAGPMAEEVKERSFVISYIGNVGSSSSGTFIANMVVLPSGSARPTAEQIMAGQDGQGNAALGTFYYDGVSPEYVHVDLVDGEYVRNASSGAFVNVCQAFKGGFVEPNTTYEAYVLHNTPEAIVPIIGHTQVTTKREVVVPELSISGLREGEKEYLEDYAVVKYHYRVGATPEDWADVSENRVLTARSMAVPASEAVDASEATPLFFSRWYGLGPNPPTYSHSLRYLRFDEPGDQHIKVRGLRYGERYRVYVSLEAFVGAFENRRLVSRTVTSIDVCERCETEEEEEVVPVLSGLREAKEEHVDVGGGYTMAKFYYTVGVAPEGWDDASEERYLRSYVGALPVSKAIPLHGATFAWFVSAEVEDGRGGQSGA